MVQSELHAAIGGRALRGRGWSYAATVVQSGLHAATGVAPHAVTTGGEGVLLASWVVLRWVNSRDDDVMMQPLAMHVWV